MRSPHEELHREALEHRCGEYSIVEVVERGRNLEKVRHGIHPDLAVGAVGRQGVGDAVARREPGDAGADHLDAAGALEAEHDRERGHRPGVRNAAAVIGIDEVEPDRLVPEPDLAGAGRGHVERLPAKHAGGALLVDHGGHRHRLSSSRD